MSKSISSIGNVSAVRVTQEYISMLPSSVSVSENRMASFMVSTPNMSLNRSADSIYV